MGDRIGGGLVLVLKSCFSRALLLAARSLADRDRTATRGLRCAKMLGSRGGAVGTGQDLEASEIPQECCQY